MAHTNEKRPTKIAEFLPYLRLPVAENEPGKVIPMKPGEFSEGNSNREKSSGAVEQELQSMYKDINAAIEETKTKLLEVFQHEMQKTLMEAATLASERVQAKPVETHVDEATKTTAGLRLIEGGSPSKVQATARPMDETGEEPALSTVEQDIEEHEEEQPQTSDLSGGTVRLSVNSHGQMRQALQFVQCLYQKPQLRLIRLVGNYKDKLDIWIGLREPICMREYLMQIKDVSKVVNLSTADPKNLDQAFEVQLNLAS